ncbi:MAG: hypothetical protein M1834_003757 [Cirrosporium novae-zelandiae]|nr:MAG: hypothetical protein M1834_003757 [Cirrosporium novae-zelandiae]
MPSIQTRAYECDMYGNCYQYSSGWYNWGRWVLLAIIIIAAFLFFFLISCLSARRRRRRGAHPYWGTGWAAGSTPPGHGPAQYNPNVQPYYGQYQQPPPTYGQGQNQSYFGGQQAGVELQQPQSAYQPQRGGDPVYAPPEGPPPKKERDGRRNKSSKYAEQPGPFNTAPYQGYQPAPPPPTYEPPKFAQFDANAKNGGNTIHEDSLPVMPSWDASPAKRVETLDHPQQDMEMGHLNRQSVQATPILNSSASSPLVGYGQVGHSSISPGNPYQAPVSNPFQTPNSMYTTSGNVNNGGYFDQSAQNNYTPTGGFSNDYNNNQFPPEQPRHTTPAPSYHTYAPSDAGYGAPAYGASSPPQNSARPPSLLQIGRKPAPGTWRDV